MKSLQQYLVAVSVLLVLLMCAAAALLVYEVDRYGRSRSEQQLLATTRALSLVVDGELKRYDAILQALGTSDSVRGREWSAFDRAARNVLSSPDAWIVVGDRSGQQLVNTRLAPGSKLPAGPPLPQLWAELDKGRGRICNLSRGKIERHIVCVDQPIMRGGRASEFVSVIMRPDQLGAVVRQQRLQPGSFATILDRRGVVIWRSAAADRFIGKPAPQDVRAAIAGSKEGILESVSLEGVPAVGAYSRSPLSGWTFIVGVPQEVAQAGSTRTLLLALGGAIGLLLIGALIGLMAARRIARAVNNLAEFAVQIERGAAANYEPTGLNELDAAGEALANALQARKASEDRYKRIFDQASDLILTADLNQVITDCNPSAAAAVGIAREEAIGRQISDFVSPDDFERTSRALQEKLGAGGTTRYDVRVRSSSGEWLSWEINSGLTYDRHGSPVELHVVGRDITDRKRAEERQRLLINELNHRVKNTLAVVQSITHQTLRRTSTDRSASEALEGRLTALSAAHDVLTRESWSSASMREIIENGLKPFCSESRCTIEGPELRLNPRTAVSMALAIHELATNAAKYGALSTSDGHLSVSWAIADERLSFTWQERGGPPVEQPHARGFGSRLIERGLSAEFGGTAEMTFEESGLVFGFSSPVPAPE